MELIQRADRPFCHQQQTEAAFSINVSQSEGLPPSEIYLLYGGDQPNESALEAETPAHGNLSTKGGTEEATTLKHPRAPKNKRQASPKKFTFDDLTPDNSFIESRDEDDPKPVKAATHDKVCSRRDSALDIQINAQEVQSYNHIGEMVVVMKTPDKLEQEDGAFWFTECGVRQIVGQNSYPTVPFDEDPDHAAAEFNLFCNRPPPTLTPHAATEARDFPMVDQLEPIQENVCRADSQMKTDEEADSPVVSPMQAEKPKANPPTLSPSTAAVMNRYDVLCFQDDLEMAPSDELENRGTFEECIQTEGGATYTSGVVDDAMEAGDEEFDAGEPNEDIHLVKTTADEILLGENGESNERMEETNKGATTTVEEEQNSIEQSLSSEEELKGIQVLSDEEKEPKKIEVPSVVSPSGDSDEHVEMQAMAAVSMGDLRQQFDHLRVSDALEAVSQSLKDQPFLGAEPFLGTEFCGQQIMDWFGSKK